jgi:hypothetical protein
VEKIADIDLKIAFVEGHFFGVDLSPQDPCAFDTDGGSGVHNALSVIGYQNPHIFQAHLIAAGVVDSVCIDAAGAVGALPLSFVIGLAAFGLIEHFLPPKI